MKLYISHSSGFDFANELYAPLKNSITRDHDIFFPHDGKDVVNSKSIIKESDLILAEVSYPSTGQGIELGWADANGIRIICFYKVGSSPSSAIKLISSSSFEYASLDEMLNKLTAELSA